MKLAKDLAFPAPSQAKPPLPAPPYVLISPNLNDMCSRLPMGKRRGSHDAHLALGDGHGALESIARVRPLWDSSVFGYGQVLSMHAMVCKSALIFSSLPEHSLTFRKYHTNPHRSPS